jgi:hypothetical protein
VVWCVPSSGAPKHRFTPVLTRQGEPHPYCAECSTGLGPWEGQAGAREYRFAAREVGEALVLVAKGTTYRAAAEIARRKAGRVPPPREHRRRSAANEGQLVANWVDVCSESVCAGELPDRWPDTLAVDSQNFRVRTGPKSWRGFHVLAAVGREPGEPGKWAPTPRVLRVEPFAHKDQAAWEAFFGALAGAPRVIVSDADNALALAIDSVFGDALGEHRLCEWHLGRKLRERLPRRAPRRPAAPDRPHPPRSVPQPMGMAHARAGDPRRTSPRRARVAHARRQMARHLGQIAKTQIATRDPHGINSTGPVEQTLREIDR